MYRSCVDPALEFLEELLNDLPQHPPDLANPIQIMYLDLKFFKMLFWGLTSNQESSSEHYSQPLSLLSTMMHEFEQTAKELSMSGKEVLEQEPLSYLKDKILHYKERAEDILHIQFKESFLECANDHFDGSSPGDTACLVDLILDNLRALGSSTNQIAPLKQQLSFVERKLQVFGNFASIISEDSPNANGCISHIQIWANHISCLACFYWIAEMDESLASVTGNLLSDLMQKYMAYTPEVITLYLDVLKGLRYHDRLTASIPQLIVRYVDFLLEYLVVHARNDIEILRQGLIFLLSFVADPLKEDSEERNLMLAEVFVMISEVPSVICFPETYLPDFLHKIDRVMVQGRELYVVAPDLSQFSFPKTNVLGYLDSFLVNLKKMLTGRVDFIPFVKHNVEIVLQQLVFIRPYLLKNMDQENHRYKTPKDLWIQILVYCAAYVIELCPTTSISMWRGIISLPGVVEDINSAKSEVETIGDGQIYCNKRVTNVEVGNSSKALRSQATTSKNEGTFIGFQQYVTEIRDHLVRGRESLTLIFISGMPGQGKTILAKRMYNDRSVHYHFHKKVWCYVSKECKTRELLMSIAGDVGCNTNAHLKFEIQDLVQQIWRSLKGKRYLVVLDDVWDVEVWHQVGRSFPCDNNGSRILFTSRNHDLALQTDPNSISHSLRPFSNEKSWELMKANLSHCDGLPEPILEIGERIAAYCKGLPLSVALIASHLQRIAQEVDLWEQVAENLKLHLASEGCMNVIELSYKYLSNHLKPCFLYFGAFPRGEDIEAKKLKLLWIAEGFVEQNRMELANKYLDSLVAQNLVVVTKKSSTGGIKWCRVHHDLLYDLCLEKVAEDDFLRLADPSLFSNPKRYDFHHRLSINEDGHFTLSKSTSPRRELPASQIHTLLVNRCPVGSESLPNILSNFRVLTVLNLEGFHLSMFPRVILHNIHLRYLALVGAIKDIPASVVDMWNLRTLIVKGGSVVRIPDILWSEMESLEYVHIDSFGLDLKGLRANKSEMSMATTGNIEVLKGITLKYDARTEEFLGRLSRLRKLKCYCDHVEVIHPMWFSMFGVLVKLESLHLHFAWGLGDLYVDEQLPTLIFPSNLKKLTLHGIRLPWSVMSTVGKLSNLKVLKLRFGACAGTTWHLGNEEFLKLTYLHLYWIGVERMDDSGCDYPFPCLEKLLLRSCINLTEIPSSFGDICSLDTIDVFNCPLISDSIRRIVEQQRDFGNDHLQVLGLDV